MAIPAPQQGDEPRHSPVTLEEDARTILINEIHWGAVFAGAALALVTQLILNMLGVALGGSLVSPVSGDKPAKIRPRY